MPPSGLLRNVGVHHVGLECSTGVRSARANGAGAKAGDSCVWSTSLTVGCRRWQVPPTLSVALRTPDRRHRLLNHAVKGRMPTNEGEAQPKPLALAVVRKAIEESRGRAAHVTEGTCRLCGSPTIETYSSLPWGTQVRLLVCPDVHCGAVAAVPARPTHDSPPLGPDTKSS
jgi:hypothetical protein